METEPSIANSFFGVYKNKRVLVTGHTGFKGSWLSLWLTLLGAKVTGCSLPPPTEPSLFEQLQLQPQIDHHICDIRDRERLFSIIRDTNPDFIFHLAAQPLVRLSYQEPVETFEINTLGTLNLLESVRTSESKANVIIVTTDKCYENKEWAYGYREDDPLGGHDPYSASKGAAEIVTHSYRRSFFKTGARIASARAGNVIGGGDWALDRIVPDCMRSIRQNRPIEVRNPNATRPWQHVLEPLSGYLLLGAALDSPNYFGRTSADTFQSAFNFGPEKEANRPVKDLVRQILTLAEGSWIDTSLAGAPHEAALLHLSIDKAHHLLHWLPVWNFERAVTETTKWYNEETSSGEILCYTKSQIHNYTHSAFARKLPWAIP